MTIKSNYLITSTPRATADADLIIIDCREETNTNLYPRFSLKLVGCPTTKAAANRTSKQRGSKPQI